MAEESTRPRLSVVIPAYNEGRRLPQTLAEIRPWLDSQDYGYEVIVEDDGSSDDTVRRCEEIATQWPHLQCHGKNPHMGKGSCVKRGCLSARGELILVMDADHPTPIDTLQFMYPHLPGHDMVVGVRTFCGEEGSSGRRRRIVGLAQQLLAHIIVYKKSVADSQCGFKLFKRDAAQELFSRSKIHGGM